jgi:hypothetical protein
MTPAEEVTAAAAKLRALATAASTDDDGTPTAHWHTEPRRPHDATSSHNLYGDYITREDGSRISWPLLNRGGSLQHRRRGSRQPVGPRRRPADPRDHPVTLATVAGLICPGLSLTAALGLAIYLHTNRRNP